MNKKKRSFSRIPIYILTFVVATSAAFLSTYNDSKDVNKYANTNTTVTETETETTKAEILKASFVAVGDNLIHSKLYEQAKERAGGNGYDFKALYQNVADDIKNADIASINQETIIAPSKPPSTYPMFNSPPELGKEVVNIGFDIINIANNHMLDKGASGLKEAIEFWHAQEGVQLTGAYLNETEMLKPETITRNGIVFGLVGMTELTNGLSLPSGSELRYLNTADVTNIRKKIELTKEVADVVVVNVHWGNEYSTKPSDTQKALARKLVEWGADVIIGHHPHVLQTIELITKMDGGTAVVAYSLGNFVSMQNTGPTMIGGMLKFNVIVDKSAKLVTVEDVKLEPLVMHHRQSYLNGRLYKLSQYSEELAAQSTAKIKTPAFSMDYIKKHVKSIIPEEFLKLN
ncbi:MAG: CapA family protein [Clostridiales bacterium]|jgi:poly-gamma-glutamate capsule biosynthesis protein CapA/YwtB (metallophosphatase superfamily)|nr:CapA family protein [Clostridiales bacterium]